MITQKRIGHGGSIVPVMDNVPSIQGEKGNLDIDTIDGRVDGKIREERRKLEPKHDASDKDIADLLISILNVCNPDDLPNGIESDTFEIYNDFNGNGSKIPNGWDQIYFWAGKGKDKDHVFPTAKQIEAAAGKEKGRSAQFRSGYSYISKEGDRCIIDSRRSLLLAAKHDDEPVLELRVTHYSLDKENNAGSTGMAFSIKLIQDGAFGKKVLTYVKGDGYLIDPVENVFYRHYDHYSSGHALRKRDERLGSRLTKERYENLLTASSDSVRAIRIINQLLESQREPSFSYTIMKMVLEPGAEMPGYLKSGEMAYSIDTDNISSDGEIVFNASDIVSLRAYNLLVRPESDSRFSAWTKDYTGSRPKYDSVEDTVDEKPVEANSQTAKGSIWNRVKGLFSGSGNPEQPEIGYTSLGTIDEAGVKVSSEPELVRCEMKNLTMTKAGYERAVQQYRVFTEGLLRSIKKDINSVLLGHDATAMNNFDYRV